MFKNAFHRPFKVLLASKGAFSLIAHWHLSSLLLVENSADTCRISLIFFAKVRGTSILKEYILVIEGTAPAIILERSDSPNLSRLFCQTVR